MKKIGPQISIRVSREGGVRGKSEHPGCGLICGIAYLLTFLTFVLPSPYLRLTFGCEGKEKSYTGRFLERACVRQVQYAAPRPWPLPPMVGMLSFGAVAAGSSGEMPGEVFSMQEASDWCPTSRLFAVAQ